MSLSTLSLVKDQDQRIAPQVYETLKDQFVPLAGRAVAGGSALSSGGAMLVETLLPFRDDFAGVALNVGRWATPVLGTGQTATVASSVLSLVLGTTANAVATVTSLLPLRPGFKVFVLAQFSQRINNQTIYFEVVSGDGTMGCGWQFDGTSNTQAKFYTTNGSTSDVSGVVTIANATTTEVVFEIEFFTAEVNFFTRVLDSASAKSSIGTKTQHVPDPDTDYFLQVRGVNGATPPGSSTTVSVEAVVIENHGEVQAEITGGRGDTIASKAIAVNLVGSTAAADALANPTAGIALSDLMGFNGSTWDRLRTASAASAAALGRLAIAQGTGPTTSLNAVTVTGAGTAANLAVAHNAAAMVVTVTGAPTAVTVNLEGSLDGTTWYTLVAMSTAAGGSVFSVDKPFIQLRANLATLTGGTAPTVTAKIAAY